MSLTHLRTTADTSVRSIDAVNVTHHTLFTRSGKNTNKTAFAAGMVAETMNIQQRMSSAQPVKNPAVFPKI